MTHIAASTCLLCKCPIELVADPRVDDWVWVGADGENAGRRFGVSVGTVLSEAAAAGAYGLYSNLKAAANLGAAWDVHQHQPVSHGHGGPVPPWHCGAPMWLRPSGWHCREHCGYAKAPDS